MAVGRENDERLTFGRKRRHKVAAVESNIQDEMMRYDMVGSFVRILDSTTTMTLMITTLYTLKPMY
jgi:hypothetical protein